MNGPFSTSPPKGFIALIAILVLGLPRPTMAQVPPELAWVPDNAAGFVRLRVQDIWNGEGIKEIRDALRLAGPEAIPAIERNFGIRLPDVEHVTFVVAPPEMLLQHDALGRVPVVLVSMARAYDRERLRKAVAPKGVEKLHEGKTYYMGPDAGRPALCFVNERTFALGTPQCLQWMIEQMNRKPSAGALRPALELAGGKTQIVVGVNVAAFPKELLGQVPPPLQALVKAQALTVGIDLGKGVKLNAQLAFANPSSAQEGVAAIKAGLQMAQDALREPLQEFERQLAKDSLPPHELFANIGGLAFTRQMQAMIKGIAVEQQGETVRIPIVLENFNAPQWVMVSIAAIGAIGTNAKATFTEVKPELIPFDKPKEADPPRKPR